MFTSVPTVLIFKVVFLLLRKYIEITVTAVLLALAVHSTKLFFRVRRAKRRTFVPVYVRNCLCSDVYIKTNDVKYCQLEIKIWRHTCHRTIYLPRHVNFKAYVDGTIIAEESFSKNGDFDLCWDFFDDDDEECSVS